MGTEVVKAVNAADDLELVAMVDEGDWLFNVADAGAQVVVDFTRPDVVMDNIRFCIDQNIHCVVGTTGFDEARLATIAEWLEPKPDVGVVIAPELRHRRRAAHAVRPGGGALLPVRRDRRAAPPEQGRRALGHRDPHGPARRRRPPGGRPAAGTGRDHRLAAGCARSRRRGHRRCTPSG